MGKLFKVPAFALYFLVGLWSFFICVGIIREAFGFIGLVLSVVFFPFVIALTPWYAAFFLHNWFLLILTYGGGITASILFTIGAKLDKDPD